MAQVPPTFEKVIPSKTLLNEANFKKESRLIHQRQEYDFHCTLNYQEFRSIFGLNRRFLPLLSNWFDQQFPAQRLYFSMLSYLCVLQFYGVTASRRHGVTASSRDPQSASPSLSKQKRKQAKNLRRKNRTTPMHTASRNSPKIRELKKKKKSSFFCQRHALSTSLDIFLQSPIE